MSIHVKMPHCWKSRVAARILMCPSLSGCEAGMNDPVIDLHMLFVSELGRTGLGFPKPHRCHSVLSLRKTHLSFNRGRPVPTLLKDC